MSTFLNFTLGRMDWTDVHYRQLARIISRHTWLYTEMVVDQVRNTAVGAQHSRAQQLRGPGTM